MADPNATFYIGGAVVVVFLLMLLAAFYSRMNQTVPPESTPGTTYSPELGLDPTTLPRPGGTGQPIPDELPLPVTGASPKIPSTADRIEADIPKTTPTPPEPGDDPTLDLGSAFGDGEEEPPHVVPESAPREFPPDVSDIAPVTCAPGGIKYKGKCYECPPGFNLGDVRVGPTNPNFCRRTLTKPQFGDPNGNAYSCPSAFPTRSILHGVTSAKACQDTLLNSGEFISEKTGKIYKCPNNFVTRTVLSAIGLQACENTKIPTGQFKDGSTLYSCPAPFTKRTGHPIDSNKACEKASVRRGRFKDPNGNVYSCPSTNPRRTISPVTDGRACEKVSFTGGEFRHGDAVYKCPPPFSRRTAHSINGTKACEMPSVPRGTFKDPNGNYYQCNSPYGKRTVHHVDGALACERTTAPRGSFKDIGLGKFYKCPSSHPTRTILAANSNQACEKTRFTSPEFKDGTSYYRCPSSHPHRTIHHIGGAAACERKPGTGNFYHGDKVYSCKGWDRSLAPINASNACTRGCPRGQFHDLGNCRSCPSGYNRTAEHIDHAKACSKGWFGPFARATNHGTVNKRATFIANKNAKSQRLGSVFSGAEKEWDIYQKAQKKGSYLGRSTRSPVNVFAKAQSHGTYLGSAKSHGSVFSPADVVGDLYAKATDHGKMGAPANLMGDAAAEGFQKRI